MLEFMILFVDGDESEKKRIVLFEIAGQNPMEAGLNLMTMFASWASTTLSNPQKVVAGYLVGEVGLMENSNSKHKCPSSTRSEYQRARPAPLYPGSERKSLACQVGRGGR